MIVENADFHALSGPAELPGFQRAGVAGGDEMRVERQGQQISVGPPRGRQRCAGELEKTFVDDCLPQRPVGAGFAGRKRGRRWVRILHCRRRRRQSFAADQIVAGIVVRRRVGKRVGRRRRHHRRGRPNDRLRRRVGRRRRHHRRDRLNDRLPVRRRLLGFLHRRRALRLFGLWRLLAAAMSAHWTMLKTAQNRPRRRRRRASTSKSAHMAVSACPAQRFPLLFLFNRELCGSGQG